MSEINDFVSRLVLPVQEMVRMNMLWNVRNAIAYTAQQKQELEELEQYAEQVVAKGEDWGAW